MTAREHAQLSLRRTGGLAGLPMAASLDTRDLDADEAGRIADALDGVEFAKVGNQGPRPSGEADRFHYQLEVRRGDRTHEVAFGEREMPAELAPLVRRLMAGAEPAR